MPTKTTGQGKLFNARPELAKAFVDVMHKYQQLGLDIEMLRVHLASIEDRPDVGVRVLACMLTCAVLEEKLVQAQIIAVGGESKNGR